MNNISEQDLKNIYKEITSCIMDTKNKNTINILKKYYNKTNPILDVNNPLGQDYGNMNVLSIASYYNNYKAVKFLLENNADPNIKNKDTYPLILAAAKGNLTSVMYLIQHGANINAVDSKGGSALIRACERVDLSVDIIKYFFDKKYTNQILDIDYKYNNQNCFEIALSNGSHQIARSLNYIFLQNKVENKDTVVKKTKFKI